jgi:hypothetical protein
MSILASLLLAVHLLCVNVAAGGPLLAAWLDWRAVRGDAACARAAVYLARLSLLGLIAGAALGLLIGWLQWDADYRALWLGPLNYKLTGAVIEAVFSLVLLAAWWLWLPGKAGGSRTFAGIRIFLALLASTNLLYHFPLLFSVAARLKAAGDTSGPVISGAAFRSLIDGQAAAMAVHVTLASIAVAGVVLLGLALRWRRRGEATNAGTIGRLGARWALTASLIQLPVGVWLLMSLRPAEQAAIMGQSTVGVLLFVASILTALWLLNDLSQLALGEFQRHLAIRAMAAMLVTIMLMTIMRGLSGEW